jgi:hypothetical protein
LAERHVRALGHLSLVYLAQQYGMSSTSACAWQAAADGLPVVVADIPLLFETQAENKVSCRCGLMLGWTVVAMLLFSHLPQVGTLNVESDASAFRPPPVRAG